MGQLYEKMASDLKLRRYSIRTQKSYLWAARRFVRHFMRAPDAMGTAEITTLLDGNQPARAPPVDQS